MKPIKARVSSSCSVVYWRLGILAPEVIFTGNFVRAKDCCTRRSFRASDKTHPRSTPGRRDLANNVALVLRTHLTVLLEGLSCGAR